jgi:nitroreductase
MERREIDGSPFVRYRDQGLAPEDGLARGEALYSNLDGRRSVRSFSDRPVPRALIETAIRTASTAPSGAHQQPWTFVAVSNPTVKKEIRQAAEEEERRNYGGRMPPAWQDAISHLGTNAHKPYLEIVPWLVVLFVQTYSVGPDGERVKHYYPRESIGLAGGMFLASVHTMGLASLTHTPSPMAFLGKILERPKNETAFLLCPVGYPADDCFVPELRRKALEDVAIFVE